MFMKPMNMLRIGLSSRVCNENLVIIFGLLLIRERERERERMSGL